MWFSNLKISRRLGIGFGLLVGLAVIVGIVALQEFQQLARLNEQIYNHPLVVSNTTRDIKANVNAMHRHIKEVVLAEDNIQINAAADAIAALEAETHQFFDVVLDKFLGDPKDVTNARDAFRQWRDVRDNVILAMRNGEKEQAAAMILDQGTVLVNDMNRKIQVMIDFAENKAADFHSHTQARKRRSFIIMVGLIALTAVMGILVATLVTKSITAPIKKLIPLASDTAHGMPVPVQETTRRDEVGHLVESFNKIIRANDRIVSQVKAVAQGDFSFEIGLRSEADELGTALRKMTGSLRDTRRENELQEWLNRGQSTLNDQMRGEKDIVRLCDDVLNCLSVFLNAQAAAFFLPDKNGELSAVSGYAVSRKEDLQRRFAIGEGLVGQVAADKSPLVVRDVPDDYFQVVSGLGTTAPGTIVFFPLTFQGRVRGVLEIAFLGEIGDRVQDFLRLVARPIAIAIHGAESRENLARLYEQTRTQAEELQASEEELQRTNRELEAQAMALKDSEAKLQVQQEELRQANEELEEHTQQLEEQKEDIERKNAALRDARKMLEEKARDLELINQYKSEFLANMSHELRTPLNSILLLSKIMSENKEGNLSKDQMESAALIYSSGSDLLKLINEVLDLSKVEAGKLELQPEAVSLVGFVRNMERKFKPNAREKSLSLVVDLDNDLPDTIWTDLRRLEQIIRNFMSNAFKFTSKGRVGLKVSALNGNEVSGHAASDSDNPVNHRVVISVSDTGIGIPESQRERIFEAFQQADGTTSRQYGGTGLGLSISRELARLLGGEIQLESREGEGSTFSLLLPEKMVQPDPGTAQAEEPDLICSLPSEATLAAGEKALCVDLSERKPFIKDDRHNISRGEKSILVIEDDPNFCQVLKGLANDNGFKCLVAEDGETGLQFAEVYNPSAILMDVGLPGINGLAVMARLKENAGTRHIPVHFISGHDKQLEAMKMGAVDYFLKPVSPDTLTRIFGNVERIISKPVKDLLVVEDDHFQQKLIAKVIGNGDVRITFADSAQGAYDYLKSGKFDCMVLDLGLPDMSGVDLLSKIRSNTHLSRLPIVVYTGQDLNQKETAIIDSYAESTIIKSANSHQKLLDETALFLHRVEANLPSDQKKILKMLHNKEAIFSGKRILLVDDDMRNLFSLRKTLEEKKMEVVIAKNGREALDRMEAHPDIQLVLMDMMMPEMDGYQAMKAIRKQTRFRKLPIIAITAKAMRGDRTKCIEAGASDYLAKPIDTDRLFAMMRVWLY